MNEAAFKNSHHLFQQKYLYQLRKDLIGRIPTLEMSDEKKSYFTHQVANVHNFDDLTDLLHLIGLPFNHNQKISR